MERPWGVSAEAIRSRGVPSNLAQMCLRLESSSFSWMMRTTLFWRAMLRRSKSSLISMQVVLVSVATVRGGAEMRTRREAMMTESLVRVSMLGRWLQQGVGDAIVNVLL